MSNHVDSVIFIGHRQAKVFHFNAQDEVKLVYLHTSAQRRHHQAHHEDRTKHAVDDEFLLRVTGSLDPVPMSDHLPVCGPAESATLVFAARM